MGLFSKNTELQQINEKLDLILDYLTNPNQVAVKQNQETPKQKSKTMFFRTQPFVLKKMKDGEIWSATDMQKELTAQYPHIKSGRAAKDAMKNLIKKGKINRLARNAYKIAR